MSNRYRVSLRRENGSMKTVMIDDCYSSDEAMQTAESMYGLEAFNAIYVGNATNESSSGSTSSMSDSDALGGLLGFGALALIGGIIMFVIQYWWIFLIIAIVLGGLLWLGRDEL